MFPNYAEICRLNDDRMKCYGVWGEILRWWKWGNWMNFLQFCLQSEKIKGMSCQEIILCERPGKKDFKTLWCSNFCCLQLCFKADGKKQNQPPITGPTIPTQPVARPSQPPQPLQPLPPNPVQQTGVPTSGPSPTTLHVLPAGNFILHCFVNAVTDFFFLN